MYYQVYVLFLFVCIISAPCVFAYLSYRRETRARESRDGQDRRETKGSGTMQEIGATAATAPPAQAKPVVLAPRRRIGWRAADKATQRAEAVAAIVAQAERRFRDRDDRV